MKKKLTAVALIICMIAIMLVGATMAYFTDTDDATNTFTTGKVDITLNEVFDEDNAKLLPGKENAIQKEVTIELADDSEDAYVWYEYLIPAVLDSTDGSTGTNNVVHVNAFGYTWDTYRENQKYWPQGQNAALPLEQTWDHDANVELQDLIGPEGFIGKETIDGIEYNIYVVLYHGLMSNNEDGQTVTSVGMNQVYMDAGVDYDNENGYYVDKNGNKIEYDFDKDIDIIVRAYGIQAEGFDDVYAAYTAYNAE